MLNEWYNTVAYPFITLRENAVGSVLMVPANLLILSTFKVKSVSNKQTEE